MRKIKKVSTLVVVMALSLSVVGGTNLVAKASTDKNATQNTFKVALPVDENATIIWEGTASDDTLASENLELTSSVDYLEYVKSLNVLTDTEYEKFCNVENKLDELYKSVKVGEEDTIMDEVTALANSISDIYKKIDAAMVINVEEEAIPYFVTYADESEVLPVQP